MLRSSATLKHGLARSASTVRTIAAWPPQASAARWLLRRRARHGLDAAAVPGARSPKMARVEAALFAAAEPLTAKRIKEIAHLSDASEARALVGQLKSLYDSEGSAFTIDAVAQGWQLRTRPEFAPWLEKLQAARGESRLSQPALETLAIVAYRQPVLRTDIEAIRGVSCGEMLRQLLARGLVRIAGRHESLGRPILYGTTKKFLEVFGLASLEDLPLAEQLRVAPAAAHAGSAAQPAPSSG